MVLTEGFIKSSMVTFQIGKKEKGETKKGKERKGKGRGGEGRRREGGKGREGEGGEGRGGRKQTIPVRLSVLLKADMQHSSQMCMYVNLAAFRCPSPAL